MKLRAVTLKECRRFVDEHHRHAGPPRGWLFGVGLVDDDGELIGVAIAGRPVGHAAPGTIEITRVCVREQHPNGSSMLYGALCRAAKALGWETAITYTLAHESGASLRAAGFVVAAPVRSRSWDRATRPRQLVDLFGDPIRPVDEQPKTRWHRSLNGAALPALRKAS